MKQIITTHKNTDFDALASLMGAQLLYPDAIPVMPKQVNPNVRAFLSIHKDFFNITHANQVDTDTVERLIVVDTNSWQRLDGLQKLKDKTSLDIHLWDHHTPGDIDASQTCQEAVGATITLIIRELKAQRKLLTPIQATLFLAGLYEDTGNLSFPSTTAEDARAAAFLLERKADLGVIAKFLRPAYGEKQKDVLFEMLKSAERFSINGYKISLAKIQVQGHVDSLALVVRMYMDIANVDAAFGIFENKERRRTMVIGRSTVDGINVGGLMKSLGGGGHPGAGSALLKSVNPDTVAEMIHGLVEGNQQASVQISDLMSFPVVSVPASALMQDVARLLREKGCTGVPVVEDGDRLVGIISRRDFKKIRKRSDLKKPVKAYMSTNVKYAEPGISPIQAARIMVRHDVGRLPVVQDGHMIGIVTRSDTMLYFYDLLPD